MGSLFKRKKPKISIRLLEIPYYKDVAVKLSDYFKGLIGQPGPRYEGEKVAPLTQRQRRGLEHLDVYADTKTPEIIDIAAQEVKKTFTGDYDPTKSIYYKAFREAAKKNLQELQENIGNLAAGGGRYWTGARMKLQTEAEEDVANALNQLLGRMYEAERERRYRLIPVAVDVGRIIESLPAAKAQTILNLAEIERQIEQAKLGADYEEWLRRYYQYPLDIARLATSFQATRPPQWQTIRYAGRPSPFARLLPALGGAVIGMINPAGMFAGTLGQRALMGAMTGMGWGNWMTPVSP